MKEDEIGNGFVNRIMWPMTRRIKSLPHPPDYRTVAAKHARWWLEAYEKASSVDKEMMWDGQASERWSEVYEKLRKGKLEGWPERVGLSEEAVTRVHTWSQRLSMIFARYDGTHLLSVDHLNATLEIAAYCHRCGVWLFGSEHGDYRVNKLLSALKKAEGHKLSRADITHVFVGHLYGDKLSAFLQGCIDDELIAETTEETSGRPRTMYELLVEVADDEDE